jgi:tetratricopeptide (TPR) repeat protein
VFALLFIAWLFVDSGQVNPQQTGLQAASLQAAGVQALDRKDYQQAEQIFSKIAAADPKDYSALFNLALAESALKQDDQAGEHYKQVLVLRPGLYEAELNLGILDVRDNHPADAIPLLQAAAKQKPAQPRPQRYLGEALLATGDATSAGDAFRAALAIDPKQATAELGLGQSLARQGKLDDALPHYQQAAAIDRNLKSYLLEIAVAFSKANRPKDAIPLLAQFPNDPGACEELGRLYLADNQPAEAVKQFQTAVAASPTSANRLALATAYLKNNQADLAAPILEQELTTHPDDYDLRMVVGRIYRDRRNFPNAGAQFVAAGQLKPDSVEAWNEAASAFVLAELYPQALAALDKIHSLKAETAGDYFYRAIVYDKLHQVKPALENYQKFLAAADGKFPNQEFQARQRSKLLAREAAR